MEQISVYYDDRDSRCREYIRCLNQYDNVRCKKASHYGEKMFIYEPEDIVGFIFSSNDGDVPAEISHIISRMIMNKRGKCFLIVTGGKKEMKALKSAVNHLEKRGYHVLRCCSPYLLEKKNLSVQEGIEKIMKDICEAENSQKVSDIEVYMKAEMKKSKSLRKKVWEEITKYVNYLKIKK